jgi:hypothetical protein
MSEHNAQPPAELYVKTVLSVIQAPTWAAAERIVEANPYLVDTLTDEMLSGLAQSTQSHGADPSTTHVIQQHRRLFQRCLIVGVAKAFSEVAALPKGHFRFGDGTPVAPEDLL